MVMVSDSDGDGQKITKLLLLPCLLLSPVIGIDHHWGGLFGEDSSECGCGWCNIVSDR